MCVWVGSLNVHVNRKLNKCINIHMYICTLYGYVNERDGHVNGAVKEIPTSWTTTRDRKRSWPGFCR